MSAALMLPGAGVLQHLAHNLLYNPANLQPEPAQAGCMVFFAVLKSVYWSIPIMAKKAPAKKTNTAFMKPLQPSAALAEIVGSAPIPRTEVTKKIWDYIKANSLQDSSDRRMINADDRLRPIFDGKEQVNMFEMTKLVSAHLTAA